VAAAADPAMPATFDALVAFIADKREAVLAAALNSAVHLVHYEVGRLEFRPTPTAPADLAPRLSRLLSEWSGRPWLVSLSHEEGAPTLRQRDIEIDLARKRDAANDPLVQAVLLAFPGATIEAVRDTAESAPLPEPLSSDTDTLNGEDE
jgi:DNA polymerase-3 subunit gamma/tau